MLILELSMTYSLFREAGITVEVHYDMKSRSVQTLGKYEVRYLTEKIEFDILEEACSYLDHLPAGASLWNIQGCPFMIKSNEAAGKQHLEKGLYAF